ncbi:hypothetical protein CLV62_110109 [Dysgonomonas alginatilytica]|uniref:ATP-grasp domain-containing protein n=1 Tax=Dysgonomonas alginatilytica TaxID=1605892 RepID=A0A2V3PWD9_9BACT|nr:hypothetical protein [Dysgonomonas alginatilytica]PXV64465.1 hypothetical protein CLV62_110109 [Dysgonomonas alginatilytica]
MLSEKTEKKPQLYYFNPGHEGAVLTLSPYYTAPANMVNLQYDLAYLAAWYADAEDYVLVQSELPLDFEEYLSKNLRPLPKGIISDKMNRSLTEIHLWGVSPQSINYFEKINSKYHLHFNLPQWKDELRTLSSRETAKECLRELCNEISAISTDIIPNFYSSLNEIEDIVKNEDYQFLAKAPYSSSGRGLLWLPVRGLTQTERQILQGILNKQEIVSIEKALNKELDFAMEFILDNDDIRFEGYSLFETNSKGGYLGNYIGKQENIISKICEYINIQLLEEVKSSLLEILIDKFNNFYSGCIGVDMMVYEDKDGTYKLHPCIEINVRDNMGLLALRFSQKYLDQGSEGSFYIDFTSQEGEQVNRDNQMKKEYPALFSQGKIKSGYLSLCPVNERTKYRAYVLVK